MNKIELDHLSHSSTSAFDCPLKGFRLVIKKEKRDVKSKALVLGSAFHKAMETMFFLEVWDRRKIITYFNKVFNDEVNSVGEWEFYPGAKQLDKAREEGRQMIRNMFDHHSDMMIRPLYDNEGPWVERKFTVVIGGIKVIGFIDLVLPHDNDVVVVDWKTSKKLPTLTANNEQSSYIDQLQLYSLAMLSSRYKVHNACLVFPRLCKKIDYEPDNKVFKQQEKRVKRVVSMISRYNKLADEDADEDDAVREAFPGLPNDANCRWCSFRDDCSYK